MEITVRTMQGSYPIIIEHGVLNRVKELVKDRHVFVVSDDGVPETYRKQLMSQFPEGSIHVFPNGEASKNLNTFEKILKDMLDKGVSRNDTLIALGGGVVGDLAGFAAASYMRGIKFINIPTTMLSQIDSSIGGKTAVDLAGVKNCVGAFWQPSMVIIDPDVLNTLPPRQMSNGLAEAVKMGLTGDEKLFEIFEKDDYLCHVDEIIERSLGYKKQIVEEDERESGLRKLLNFGHSYGHGYEAHDEFGRYLHGECVAMGMMTVLENGEIRDRLEKVLLRLNLPVRGEFDSRRVLELMMHDKKSDHGKLTIVQVDEIGKGHLESWTAEEIERRLLK